MAIRTVYSLLQTAEPEWDEEIKESLTHRKLLKKVKPEIPYYQLAHLSYLSEMYKS